MEGPVVEIRRDGAGFVVEVVPPDPAYPPEHFTDLRRAYGCAGGVRLVTGWRKVDLTGTPDAKPFLANGQ